MSEFFDSWSFGGFVFNVVCSLIASFSFILVLLRYFRPNIIIVNGIARSDSPFDDRDDICFGFKIINRSFFSVYDITAEASYFTVMQGENNIINKVYSNIPLKKSHVSSIKRRRLINKEYGDNCIQFFTYEDLGLAMNSQKKHIQFQVTCRHGLTGLSKVNTREFVRSSDIQDGSFLSGNHHGIRK